MVVPWVVEEAGPGARSVYITLARGCFAGYPTARVHQTTTAIRITAVVGRPAIIHGHLDMTCGGGSIAFELRSPIDGRTIEGESRRGALRFDPGFPLPSPPGLPRLLGLSPAEAMHVLSLYGFRGYVSGSGREVVSQVPGWDLFGPRRLSPVRYTGVTRLVAGNRIEIPTKPAVAPGAPTGTLLGAIRSEGGISPVQRNPAGGGVAGMIDLFNARGKLLARFRVRDRHSFRLLLAVGHYVLLDDNQGLIACSPASARVSPDETTRVIVGTGCGVI